MSCLDSAPKSMSVPSWAQLSATGSEKSRLAAINGSRRGEPAGASDQPGAAEQRVGGQRLLPAPQVVDAVRPVHKTHMRDRVEETADVAQDAIPYGVRPEL